MQNLNLKSWLKKSGCGIGIAGHSSIVLAANNLPFVSTLEIVQRAISGPFLLAAAIIMIVITCLMLAFGEWGDGFKKLINIVLWLSVAFAATTFVTSLFGA